jgi:hypothetical protein
MMDMLEGNLNCGGYGAQTLGNPALADGCAIRYPDIMSGLEQGLTIYLMRTRSDCVGSTLHNM